jgi:hypothetical protein
MNATLIHTEATANGAITPVSPGNPVPVVPSIGDSPTEITWVRGLKAPAATATPERLAADGTYVQTVTIIAMRAARVANTSAVYIDTATGNDNQLIELIPGAYFTLTAPLGKVIDLNDILVDSVTLTDGVYFLGML